MWPTALKNVQLIGRRVISREVFIFCNKSSAATSELAAPSTKQAKPFKEIPGPGGLYSIPGIGVAFYMKPFGDYYPQTIYKLFDKLHDEYGPTPRIGMLGKCVVTSDAEAFKTVFQNEGKYPQRTMGNSGIYAVYAERNNKESGLAVLPESRENIPNFSPIEHVWDTLGRRLRQRQRQPTTVQESEMQVKWNRIPQIRLGRLIRSMPRRIRACLANRASFEKNVKFSIWTLYVFIWKFSKNKR